MRGYKLTLARIGIQEKWAGWQIAGKSENTPQSAIDSFTKSQSTKGVVGTALKKAISVYEGFEFEGSYIISKTSFGLLDGLGRPCSRSDGVSFLLSENPDFYHSPDNMLSVDISNFDNMKLKELYDNDGVRKILKGSIINGDSAITTYDDNISYNTKFNLSEIIEKYFKGSRARLFTFIRCIYWTTSTPLPLYITTDFDVSELLELMYIALSVLPYSLRSKLSFRTYNVPKLEPVNVIFTSENVKNGKVLDLRTGRDNFFDMGMSNMFSNYTFIEYVTDRIANGEQMSEYFDNLDQEMRNLGGADSDDFSLINVAHNIILENTGARQAELDDNAVKEKLQTFLSLPYNSEQIDEYVAKFLSIIIKRDIQLNENMHSRLQAKLKKTKLEKLQNIGYSYNAVLMINSPNRQKEFDYLYSLKDDKAIYDIMIKKICEESGGYDFIDEYFGDFYGAHAVTNLNSLGEFYTVTASLPQKKIINLFIEKKVSELGKEVIEKYFRHSCDLRVEISHFYKEICKYVPIPTANNVLNQIRLYFWEKFNISDFQYADKDIYLDVDYRTNKKCIVVNELIKIFNNVKSQRTSTVRSFKKLLEAYADIIADSKSEIIAKFQKRCLSVCNPEAEIDFWYELAALDAKSSVKFIVENDILIFTDSDIFYEQLFVSENLKTEYSLISFIKKVSDYIDAHSDTQVAKGILDTLNYYEKELKKKLKKEKGQNNKESKYRHASNDSSELRHVKKEKDPEKISNDIESEEKKDKSIGGLFKKFGFKK